MKRTLLIAILALVTSVGMAATPIQLWDATNSRWVPAQANAAGELITTTGNINIGSITTTLSGDIRITSSTVPLTVTGTVVATIPESISIANFPADQPISGNVGISGVASVTQAGASAFVQTARTAEATAASFTTSASCESVSLFSLASTTIWFSLDGSGATVSAGIPLTATGTAQAQQSFSCGPNVVVWYIASNSSAFTALESGR